MIVNPRDREQEEEHIQKELSQCGYPKWPMKKVKDQIRLNKKGKDDKRKKKKSVKDQKFRGLVTISYVIGLSESLSRVLRKHNTSAAMKPNQTLWNIEVHPKDKQDIKDRSDVVYQTPCKNCEQNYIEESGTKFRTRLGE